MKDVLVVGAGPAGMMAAITAAENGARVTLLEKMQRVGRKMLEYAGRSNLKRVYNELGGKSAFVVFDDFADVERAARTAAGSMFFNQGAPKPGSALIRRLIIPTSPRTAARSDCSATLLNRSIAESTLSTTRCMRASERAYFSSMRAVLSSMRDSWSSPAGRSPGAGRWPATRSASCSTPTGAKRSC